MEMHMFLFSKSFNKMKLCLFVLLINNNSTTKSMNVHEMMPLKTISVLLDICKGNSLHTGPFSHPDVFYFSWAISWAISAFRFKEQSL